jgi:hypothetical protein
MFKRNTSLRSNEDYISENSSRASAVRENPDTYQRNLGMSTANEWVRASYLLSMMLIYLGEVDEREVTE